MVDRGSVDLTDDPADTPGIRRGKMVMRRANLVMSIGFIMGYVLAASAALLVAMFLLGFSVRIGPYMPPMGLVMVLLAITGMKLNGIGYDLITKG